MMEPHTSVSVLMVSNTFFSHSQRHTVMRFHAILGPKLKKKLPKTFTFVQDRGAMRGANWKQYISQKSSQVTDEQGH